VGKLEGVVLLSSFYSIKAFVN